MPDGIWIQIPIASPCAEFPLFSYNNGVVMTSCRELENSRSSALSAASAFAIATAGANEGTPTKEKYRRMSLAGPGGRRGRAVWAGWFLSFSGPAILPAEPWKGCCLWEEARQWLEPSSRQATKSPPGLLLILLGPHRALVLGESPG